jgi:hypothetical protein
VKLFVWIVFLVACTKQTRPPRETSGSGSGSASSAPVASDDDCTTDADCALVNGTPPGCCSRCEPTSVSSAAATRIHGDCAKVAQANPAYFDRCPHLDCACTTSTPHCTNRKCTVENVPCHPTPSTPDAGLAPPDASVTKAACTKDADCTLVSAAPPSCCSRCDPTAMTRADAAKAGAKCSDMEKAQPDYFKRCPHLSCMCKRSEARCRAGACVLESKGC